MNDVVWVALISSGGAVVAALAAQFLAMRAATQQAARTAHQEALLWQRSEATKAQERQEAMLREFWALVLLAQGRVVDGMARRVERSQHQGVAASAFEDSACGAAAQAYAVALIGLAALRVQAKNFYHATARVELSSELDSVQLHERISQWRDAFAAIEEAVGGPLD